MLKGKQHNRRRHLLSFAAFFCAIILLITPLYNISYNSIKDRIYEDLSYQTDLMTEAMDAEMLMYHTVREEILKSTLYTSMKNLDRFSDSSQYMILKDFADMFMGRVNMMQQSEDIYVFFKNNTCAVSKKNIFDDISRNFNDYIKMNDMSYEDFKNHMFDNSMGMKVEYVENMYVQGVHTPSIVVIQHVDRNLGQQSEAVIFGIYRIDYLFSKEKENSYKEIFDLLMVNDEIVYSKSNNTDTDNSIVTVCKNADLKFEAVISEKYQKAYMRSFVRFIWLYLILLVAVAVCLEILLSWYMNRSARYMISLVSNATRNPDIKDEKGMLDALVKLTKEKQDYEKSFLMTLFLKPLDSEECDFIRKRHPDFPEPYLFAVFYSENLNSGILEILMQKFNIDRKLVISPQTDVFVVFFEYTDDVNTGKLREAIDEMLFEAKSNGVQLTAIISIPCNGLEEFYNMYDRVRKFNRFVDHGGTFDMSGKKTAQKIHNDDGYIYDRLREMMVCGQAFEAKKIVYEQWYSVMTASDASDYEIEKIFYSQMGILAEIALKAGYKDELARYSSKKKVNELAFEVADDIDAICSLIVSRKQSGNEYERVIKYIDENYNTLDFGIPDVEVAFGLTGKTINKIVKQCTGKTFTEYLELHRLELAKKLLSNSENEIKLIAEQCGFRNYDTFYKFFKKHTSVSPVKWRKVAINNP